jgi:3-oxoadipate enol-lactonase
MAILRVGEVDLHFQFAEYTDPWGRAETILLYHGFGRNLAFWQPWVPLLARDYRVLRIDARGCGGSSTPPPGAPYDVELLVGDVLAVLDHLGIEEVHWGAEASGGHIGMAVALAHPERIASLTLCNTPFQLPASANDLFVPAEVEQYGLGHWAIKTLERRIDIAKVSRAWIDWSIAEFAKVPAHVAIAQHDMIARANLLPRLAEVTQPVLVMAGRNSKIAPQEQMATMSSTLPHAKLVLFENYGQGIAFSAPERCVAEMRAFLQDLRTQT